LTAVIKFLIQIEGQTKTGKYRVRGIVDSLVEKSSPVEFRPGVADTILDKAIQAFKAAEAARHATDSARKSVLESSPAWKLADCSSRDASGVRNLYR